MEKRTLEQAFNAIFHNEKSFEDFCELKINDEVKSFTLDSGRLVYRPSTKFKTILRFIDRVVLRTLAKDEDVVHSFVKGKSTLSAVKAHASNKYFFLTDIREFYPSIKSADVYRILKRDKDLISISDLENYIDLLVGMVSFGGSLPVGFPTSPQLSNAFLYEFDLELKNYCSDHKLIYTRYADDIIVSGAAFEELSELKELVQKLLIKYGSQTLKLKEQKTHITQFNNKVKILGLIILPNGNVTIDAKYKKKIELALFFYSNNKDKFSDYLIEEFKGDERSLFGLLHYAKSIDVSYIEKLQRKYGVYSVRALMEAKQGD